MKISGGNRLYDEMPNYVTQVLNWRKAVHMAMQG